MKGWSIPTSLPQPITWSGYNYANAARCWYNTFANAAMVCQYYNTTCCGIALDHGGADFEPIGGPSGTCVTSGGGLGYWLATKTACS